MPFEHSKSRLEGFSDAVFAFAATLLVVSLEVPDDFSALKQEIFGYIPFGLTFFALVLIWKMHYNYFRRITVIDNWIITFNMFMVFMLLFFVYPLKFLTNLAFGSSNKVSLNQFSELFQLYSFGFLLLFIPVVLLYWRSARIEPDDSRRPVLRFYARHFMLFAFVSVLSILLARYQVGLRWGYLV